MVKIEDKRRKKLDLILGNVESVYPDLRTTVSGQNLILNGSLPIIESGIVLDRYLIRIEVPAGYPRLLPRVYEIGGRIPKIPNRHFESSSEEACVCLKDQWACTYLKYPQVVDFISGPMKDFFLWQISYDHFREDRLGGWSHGGKGRLEFYQARLQIRDVEVIKKCLLHVAENKYRPDWLCYCGSGQLACKCHKATILSLRSKISPEMARSAWREIAALPREELIEPQA